MNEIQINQVNYYICDESDHEQRLDNLLIKLLKGVPQSHIYRIIRNGEVRLNKIRAQVSDKVNIGDVVRIPPVKLSIKTQKLIPVAEFQTLFEDEYYLIINKPARVACHGGSGVSFGVIEQLRAHLKLNFLELAHRLDRDTSGILILAKKRRALVMLQEIMQNNQMLKEYYALTLGKWKSKERNVKLGLSKYTTSSGERRVKIDKLNGAYSHTIFKVIRLYNEYTLVNANIKTGRTHQIRIHCKSLEHPIAGDDKYGNYAINKNLVEFGLKRMFLHAHHIKFIHPIINTEVNLNCPLPLELTKFLDHLD